MPTNIARALIGGLKHDFTANDEPIRRLIPQVVLGFDDAVRDALDAEKRHAVASRWTEGAFMFRDYPPRLRVLREARRRFRRNDREPRAIWKVVTAIGGRNRYYAFNFLWPPCAKSATGWSADPD